MWTSFRSRNGEGPGMRCRACQSLEGALATVAPHQEMRADTYYLRGDGVVEVYTCRPCGARFERFVPKAIGTESGSWKTLKPLG